MHLAETAAEFELLQDHRGPFENFLQDLGVWLPDRLAPSHDTIVELLDCYKERFETPLLWVHANYLAPSERFGRNHTIVYCPRTHAAFGHAPHPFREFLARGVRVALGTDSLASNPDLSILNEARFVHQHYPDVPGATLLRMATLSGAEALGWADETGSLTPGKSAEFVILPLPDDDWADPHELLWQSEANVRSVCFRGAWTVGGP